MERRKMTTIGNLCERRINDLIADKWTALVLGVLEGKTERFGKLKREVKGVSQKMLTHTLRELELDGFVIRKVGMIRVHGLHFIPGT